MPLSISVPLKGEIPLEDYSLDTREDDDYLAQHVVPKLSLEALWLTPTIKGGVLWGNQESSEIHQRVLAPYLNNKVEGPYLVVPSLVNFKRMRLSFIFFKISDAESFSKEFEGTHNYEVDESAFQKNKDALVERAEMVDWFPKDARLKEILENEFVLRL